ncbi:SidA/IucD/PvdA family monooxygenase [bacterium]|nr:SidA/IucD/PvdA family monooxygenase [bacterium]
MARMALKVFRRDPARPRRFDRNLVVIGGGSAGLVSAYIAAAVKAKVTLIEAHRMGGDCLNTGCVPSKALIRSAKLAHQMRHAGRWGLTPADPDVPFGAVMERVHRIIADIAPHDSVERYTGLGVEVLQGYARLIDPWTVEVAFPDGRTQRLTTRAIIIATGAAPILPDLPGLDQAEPLTSDTLWEALRGRATIPARIAILGGGPIGCELAQALQRLGAQVTLIQRGPHLLPREDDDASSLVRAALEADGVRVLTEMQAKASGKGWLDLASGERIASDALIVALGRKPRLTGFGLEALGIGGTRIEADAFLRTTHPHILVAGDVAGLYQFTHTAAHQAWFAAVNALFGDIKRFKADYRVIPWVTFTDPEVARVGLSEAEAQAQGIAVEVTRYDLDELDRAIADGASEGFIKVLTPPGKDRILGVTIVGDHAGDILSEFVLAMKHGLGLGKILSTIHAYPTWAEAAKATAGRWRQAHVSPAALRLLQGFHAWRRG